MPSHEREHGAARDHREDPEQHVDPVCGMEVSAWTARRLLHGGVYYHFCSATCLAKFAADPDRYTRPTRSAAAGARVEVDETRSRYPGLVVEVGEGWLDVKVPTGDGCPMCVSKATCSFHGPDSAYRRYRVQGAPAPDVHVGDRVTVEIPQQAERIALALVLLLPIVLVLAGISVLDYWLPARLALPWVVAVGAAVYLAALVAGERWMRRSRRFRPRLSPPEEVSRGTRSSDQVTKL